MNLRDVMSELEKLTDDKTRARNDKNGVEHHFGVKMGDIRKLAKRIKNDPELAFELWDSGHYEARCVAVLIVKPKQVSAEKLDHMVHTVKNDWVAQWLNNYIAKKHPKREELRVRWLESDVPYVARAGWALTAQRVEKNPEGIELSKLLDRIEVELVDAPSATQWTMNVCFGAIGIHHPEHRDRVMVMGENLGVYRDFPRRRAARRPSCRNGSPRWSVGRKRTHSSLTQPNHQADPSRALGRGEAANLRYGT